MEHNFHIQIKNLINTIDLKKINHKLIKLNVEKIFNVYEKIKERWAQININKIEHKILKKGDKKYTEIMSIINSNFLSENPEIKKVLNNKKYICSINYSNIHFYFLSENDKVDINDKDYLMSMNMLKIALSLNTYKFNGKDNIPRYIIWIPINKKRDFDHNKINKTNLDKSQNNFEAFVASGVTFGLKPKITIITRYEEVEKLLIHELIHNYGMDGSNYHMELKSIINKYSQTKSKNNYHYEYSIYESYTELLSTYLYLMYENIWSKTKQTDLKNKLLGQILLELIYSYNLISNLIYLNGYISYDDFANKKVFSGNICKYEYYYIKGLMYNNWELKFGEDINDFNILYSSIIKMIENINICDDVLMKEIYTNRITQKNYKYQMH